MADKKTGSTPKGSDKKSGGSAPAKSGGTGDAKKGGGGKKK